ncbi:MAG: hypothetical protein V4617_16470 [Gemmatimonadota bacterium]
MSSEVTGITTRTGRPGSSAAGPAPAVPSAPSRALTRIDPAPSTGGTRASASGSAALANPLDRSGLSLLDVLGTNDVHVVRESAAPVALEVGLETARSALLRQQPVDALAALDSVWEGARQTEDGWYLRGGALLVLGLPGEGDRVAEEGIATRPASTALRFLQSLARLTLGDLQGARSTLGMALQRLPSDRLLLAQQAVLLTRAGDDDRADAAMRAASKRAAPDDAVLVYGHAAVRAAAVDRRRTDAGIDIPDASTTDGVLDPSVPLALDTAPLDHEVAADSADPAPDGAARSAAGVDARTAVARDPVLAAVQSLGTRLAVSDADTLAREVRLLMRALSAGGSLANSSRPELSHAARSVLAVMLDVLDSYGAPLPSPSDGPDGPDGPDAPAFASLVRDVVHAARGGNPDDALRALRRHPAIARESIGALLQSMVRGALHRRAAESSASGQSAATTATDVGADAVHEMMHDHVHSAGDGEPTNGDGHDAVHTGVHQGVHDEQGGPIIPVRLGLRLIDESAASRAMLRGSAETGSDPRVLLSTSGGSGLAAAIAAARSSVRWDSGATSSDVRDATRDAGREVASDPAGERLRDGLHAAGVMNASRAPGARDRLDAADSMDAVAGAVASGWAAGAARPPRRSGANGTDEESLAEGRGARVLAMLCVIVAAAAASSGYTAVAVAFGVGASWFALRRSAGGARATTEGERTAERSSGERRH